MNEGDRKALIDLLARRESSIELDRAALAVARIDCPELDPEPYVRQLDVYASAIAERVPDLSDGERFVRAANSWLFGELRFRGNEDDYYNADNSCLNRVLETRLGIPITLSVVYMEIARRLAKPVSGIGLPGHFVVRYDDGDYSTYIDPFHGGALLDAEGCRRLIQAASPDAVPPDDDDLAPVDRRTLVMRVINNLRQVYFARHQPEHALRLLDLLIEADPMAAGEYKQRGVALMQLQRMGQAVGAFRRYLELAPDAPDRERIREHIHDLAFWLAARN